jgi:3-deoxy-7-phosphoheptulonate synthase
MIIVMRQHASAQQIADVVARVESRGLRVNISRGEERTIIGVIGDDRRAADAGLFEELPGVAECVRVLKPFKLASLDFHPAPTIVSVGAGKLAVKVGLGAPLAVMAGPCAVESQEQVDEVARRARDAGARRSCSGSIARCSLGSSPAPTRPGEARWPAPSWPPRC